MSEHRLRVLLIDDDEDDYIITRELLIDIKYQFGHGERNFELEWADSYETGLTAISEQRHDVYLIDYHLGAYSGLDLLREAISKGCTNPLILLTGQGDRAIDIKAMQAGASDYLVKDQIDAPLLERSIRYAIERKRAADVKMELETQLRQAQRLEAVGRLAGGIAHDFNNMLTALMGYAGLALESIPEDSPAYGDIQGIQKITQRAADLTQQLLAFSRRQMNEPQVINPNNLLLNIDKLLRRLSGPNIEFKSIPGPDVAWIKVDPGQLEQVLTNLVMNARDALPQGGTLTIKTQNILIPAESEQPLSKLPSGPYVLFSVTDTGIGMTEEIKSQIFEPFFTTKEVGAGTGLGLATCFGIVKQNDGHIDVESKPGLGTTVKVYLPGIEKPSEVNPPTEIIEASLDGQETVLLVEDEPAVRTLIAHTLLKFGYTVLEANNGSDGLQLVQDHSTPPLDLLITDLVMPKMGGKLLANKLKANHPDLKVLYISGFASDIITVQDMIDPSQGFLQKPFSQNLLIQRVREILDK